MNKNIIKKIVLLILTLNMIMISTIYADEVTFSDIEQSWAKECIEKVAELGIVKGSNGMFRPKDKVKQIEALVMLTRLYSIDDKIKSQIEKKYDKYLSKNIDSKYSWAYKELSYALEIGIVSVDGLKVLNDKKLLGTYVNKEEVAVLLSKAMLLNDEVKKISSTVFTMPFNDSYKITSKARPYMYIMNKVGIIGGDTNKNANPKSEIKREVFAKMVFCAYEYIVKNSINPAFDNIETYKQIKGLVTSVSINSIESYLEIQPENSKDKIMVRISGQKTEIIMDDIKSNINKVKKDMLVDCTVSESNNIATRVVIDTSVTTVEGILGNYSTHKPMHMTVKIKDNKSKKYNVPDNITVKNDNKLIDFEDLVVGDIVKIKFVDDIMVSIESISRVKTYEGKITDIVYDIPIKLRFLCNDGEEKVFTYVDEPDVSRDEVNTTFDQLRVGDTAYIRTIYDELSAIDAKSCVSEVDMVGVVNEIIIGSSNKIRIKDEEGVQKTYKLVKNAEVYVLNQTSSVYDLRVGYSVKIKFSGDEIKYIEATKTETSQQINAKVVYVNTSNKIIMAKIEDDYGNGEIIYISLDRDCNMFTLTGRRIYLKDLEIGNSIISVGSYNGGEFNAVSIIVK